MKMGSLQTLFSHQCLEEEKFCELRLSFSEVCSLLASYSDPRNAFRNAWETVVL
jgi:hypothetical protein